MHYKLCDAESDTSPIDTTTVRGVARANASKHFKIGRRDLAKKTKKKRRRRTKDDEEEEEEGSTNAMLLHCETCAARDDGRNVKQLQHIHRRVHLSSVGALCNNALWVCMTCAEVLDAEHAKDHVEASENCHLLLQCHDSHVYCSTCSSYQYPREVGGTTESNAFLDPIVYEWLIIYGKLRLWWRSIDETFVKAEKRSVFKLFGGRKKKKNSSAITTTMPKRGITNYGNTCFFTSTCQAIMSIPALVLAVENDPSSSEYPVQQSLKQFIQAYKKTNNKTPTLDPRNIWDTVQEHALFGNYDENTMEDARSLWLDIQDTLNPRLKRCFFDYSTKKRIVCKHCGDQGTWENEPTDTVLQVNVKPEHEMSGEETKQHDDMMRHCIGMDDIPMNLCDMVKQVFAPVDLDDYKCEKCDQRGGCQRLRRVTSLPKVLICQINRSYQLEHVRPPFSFKCHRSVTCGDMMQLSLAENESKTSNGEEVNYQLCGLNVHDGGLGGGHNMAYRLDVATREWSWFSDQHFGVVSGEEVARSEASIAFYVRLGDDDLMQAEMEKEQEEQEERIHVHVPQKCKGGCGFFGKEDQDWYCSHCAVKHGIATAPSSKK